MLPNANRLSSALKFLCFLNSLHLRGIIAVYTILHGALDLKYISDFEDIAEYLKKIASPDRLIITIGAGNVFKILDLLK